MSETNEEGATILKETCCVCNKVPRQAGEREGMRVIHLSQGDYGKMCPGCWHLKKQNQMKAGWLYIIGQGEFWKVGITTRSPEVRLKEMQCGNPKPLEVLQAWLVPFIAIAENLAHARLKEIHYRGEWYNGTPDRILNILGRSDPPFIEKV